MTSQESRLRADRHPWRGRLASAAVTIAAAATVAVLTAPPLAQAQSAVTRNVVAAGGGTASTSSLLVRTTVGQPVAGSATAAGLTLRAGFWIPGTGVPIGVTPRDLPPPARFALHPNRPNPFRGPTAIRFDVPAGGGAVRLEVFDLRGRRVAVLLDDLAPPGEQEFLWNGRDERGVALSAGIYLAVLRTPAGALSRKLTLLH